MRFVVIILALGWLSLPANGGQLDEIEKKASKNAQSPPASSPPPSRNYDSSSSFGSGTYPSSSGGESFLGGFFAWLVAAPFQYRHDDPAGSLQSDSEASLDDEGWADEGAWFPKHAWGDATVPYVRADYNWQHINSNLKAVDLRIEAGYKLLAFYGRHTLYSESNPADELTVNQYYGMLRFGGAANEILPGTVEVGLGVGAVQHIGNEEHVSGAFTVPVKFYPADWVGFEFRPAWYQWKDRNVGDYDLSASFGYRFVQFRGGYRWRWMKGIGHQLNGPYAGVSVSF